MKNLEFFILLALMAILSFSSCDKNDSGDSITETQHNPFYGTVWESHTKETPGGRFISNTDRLLFKTESSGEIFSMTSTVYFSGDNPGDLWDTSVAMTYKLDPTDSLLYIISDFYVNPGCLRYNLNKEVLSVVGSEKV